MIRVTRCTLGGIERHFKTRQNEHMKGKNNSEIGHDEHAPKRENFKIVGQYQYPFITESLYNVHV